MIWTCWPMSGLSLNCEGACNMACGDSLLNLYLNCIETFSWISWISCLGSLYATKSYFICFQKPRAKRCLIKPQPVAANNVTQRWNATKKNAENGLRSRSLQLNSSNHLSNILYQCKAMGFRVYIPDTIRKNSEIFGVPPTDRLDAILFAPVLTRTADHLFSSLSHTMSTHVQGVPAESIVCGSGLRDVFFSYNLN